MSSAGIPLTTKSSHEPINCLFELTSLSQAALDQHIRRQRWIDGKNHLMYTPQQIIFSLDAISDVDHQLLAYSDFSTYAQVPTSVIINDVPKKLLIQIPITRHHFRLWKTNDFLWYGSATYDGGLRIGKTVYLNHREGQQAINQRLAELSTIYSSMEELLVTIEQELAIGHYVTSFSTPKVMAFLSKRTLVKRSEPRLLNPTGVNVMWDGYAKVFSE